MTVAERFNIKGKLEKTLLTIIFSSVSEAFFACGIGLNENAKTVRGPAGLMNVKARKNNHIYLTSGEEAPL